VRQDTPSFTAAWVAGMRGLGTFLPPRLRLVEDPFGLRFTPWAARLARPGAERRARATSRLWLRGAIRGFAIYMQLRTRVIDDDMTGFARGGGKQVVLLGAGFDARAWRLADLEGATVFEVDHPATQARKRAVMGAEASKARVVFVPWDFEHQPVSELPARLAQEGHDPRAPTMTVLEGVVMYLTAPALDATLSCIASYSAPGSPFAVTYLDRRLVGQQRSLRARIRRLSVRLVGEPFRSAFDPPEWAALLGRHGFVVARDESAGQVARRLLSDGKARAADAPPSRLGRLRAAASHFALARRSP
jgi:methyltransferase (TIGR00027 family)